MFNFICGYFSADPLELRNSRVYLIIVFMFCGARVAKVDGAEKSHNKSTIDACLSVHERIFALHACVAIVIMSCEEFWMPPWASVWKLQDVVDRRRLPA